MILRRFFRRVLKGKLGKSETVGIAELPDSIGEGSEIKGRIIRSGTGGKVHIGKNCLIEGVIKTETPDAEVIVGDNVYIGGLSLIASAGSISIGSDVLISYRVIVMDNDSHSLRASERKTDLEDWRKGGARDWSSTAIEDVVIEKGAWLGASAMVLKGVRIGEGGIVGAGSVVSRDVLPWTIVAGNPARVVRELNENER